MTLNASIPVRREPDAGDSAAGSELAWVGALILLLVLVLSFWGKLRNIRVGRKDSRDALSVMGWLGRWQGRSAHAPLVVGSTRLTPTHTLHDVEWQGRRLLVGCSAQTIQVLSEVPAAGAGVGGLGSTGDSDKGTR